MLSTSQFFPVLGESMGEAGSADECQPKLEKEIQPCESQPKYFDKFLGRKAHHKTNVGRSESRPKQKSAENLFRQKNEFRKSNVD